MANNNQLTVTQELEFGRPRWLHFAHLLAVATWLGSTVCWGALLGTAATTSDSGTLKAAYESLHILDVGAFGVGVVVPSAFLVLITGLLQGALTEWGLFRFRWIMVKEAAVVVVMAVGGAPVAVWKNANIAILSVQGPGSLQNPEFLRNQALLLTANAWAVAMMVAMVVIAVFKPWGQRGRPNK